MSWSDDKKLSSGADAIGWNSLKKKKQLKKRKKRKEYMRKNTETKKSTHILIPRKMIDCIEVAD